MNDPRPADKDQLVTRPEGPLPTTLEPASPEARGHPTDPKPGPEASPDNHAGTSPEELGRSA